MTHGPIPDYQKHRIAASIAAGVPSEIIARSTGIPEDTIKGQIQRPTESMTQLVDHYRFQQNSMLVKFKMETAELADEATRVIDRTLRQEKDPRLAYDAAKDVLSLHGILFPRDKAGAAQVNTQLNVYGDDRTIQAMQHVADSIRDSTEALRDSLPTVGNITGSRHITVSQADVVSERVDLQDMAENLKAPVSTAPTGGGNGSDKP